MKSAQGVTQLLERWNSGDRAALNELVPLVYGELHRLAKNFFRRRPNHTLQPTALINEVYLRMVGQQGTNWQGRAHFFGVAAKTMRNLLVDHARLQKASKRGGSQLRLSLADVEQPNREAEVDCLALDEALKKLTGLNPQYGQVVELRYFGGLTIEETAEVMSVSHATVERDWKFARVWLKRELSE
ncbi:MAG TPA: sigma-70 family RNA polymerase sigma factor [Blastocatellia bacterium]|nr:sigma-70 family RNA polymerase sigma factor [Blastocatellia bacterium]